MPEQELINLSTLVIGRFLSHYAQADLASLYSENMEVQVNVAQDEGEITEGDYQGRHWRGYTNGIEVWKPFRIPWNAKTDPEYIDRPIKWNFEAHVESIGMTGWDWKNRVSKWVAFDFDSILNHAAGLTQEELLTMVETLKDIEWVTIRKSTSGTGLHIYIYIDDYPTKNHVEHSALARAILGKLAGLTALDLQTKVDVCGGNMWVWHRKSKGTDGLTLIKSGIRMQRADIPINWQDHIGAISKTNKNRNTDIESTARQRNFNQLDNVHRDLLRHLDDMGALWWWDQDLNMLVTHTFWLKRAHEELGLLGVFETNSPATEVNEQNCFCFPLKGGAWSVRRYTPGILEHGTWDQDGHGWTRCYFNKQPDLYAAASMNSGVENKKGAYEFNQAETGISAARLLGAYIDIPIKYMNRKLTIKRDTKDDKKIVVELQREPTDEPLVGWIAEKNVWFRKFFVKAAISNEEPEISDFDDYLRHITTCTDDDCGWALLSDATWRFEPLAHIKAALKAMGNKTDDLDKIIGAAILRPWKKVTKPLQPEYPAGREWNINAAQFSITPSISETLNFPSWTKLLQHCGAGLDTAIKEHPWARANGLTSGADYLKCWIASLLQKPEAPLPYLFFYGEQNTGKSIFHEAFSLLITRGCVRADIALSGQQTFNAELANAIMCVVEETDLNKSKTAYNRIKDWVTGREILIHEKRITPYPIVNTTHWVQCSNERSACPIFPGDTRITMLHVEPLDPMDLIPKSELLDKLKKEAADFLAEVLKLELPEPVDRLNIPAIETSDKLQASNNNMTPLERFISEKCFYVPGASIKYSEFYEEFIRHCEPQERIDWTQRRLGRELPPKFPKGRNPQAGSQWFIGNISFESGETIGPKYVLRGETLALEVL